MKVVHSWLKDYVGDTLPDFKKVEELLTFHSFEVEETEMVEGEPVIEVKVLPDRASDCLSHRGIAHELATILDIELVNDPLKETPEFTTADNIVVKIADPELCPRFTASLITGVEVKESPAWLKKRLLALGQRPINNIVDATNYVMYAIGQPMHAYDADKFPQVNGVWQFDIRLASEGENISLLSEGGKEEERIVELTGEELLIVDGSSNTPVGLAGVKGGRSTELNSRTKNIILEAASFNPKVIRKTARRLGILTDASKRFENEPSRELPLHAQNEIIKLILDIAGGNLVGVKDEYLIPQKDTSVSVSTSGVNRLLGLSLTAAEVKSLIERTGSIVTESESGQFTVVPPRERNDLTIDANFIDEVGRIYGLNNVQSVLPETVPLIEVNIRQYYSDAIRESLVKLGFSEVITSSFQKKGDIQLQNALASDKGCMRENLAKNISQVLDANISHTDLLGLNDVRVFEIGTVFYLAEYGVAEYVSLALGVRTKGNGYSSKDDVVLKLGCEAVAKVLGVELSWQTDKGIAELNLTSIFGTLPVPSAYNPLPERVAGTYQTPSPYPAVARDIALWVGETESSTVVLSTLSKAAGSLCIRQTLFDTFTKDGRTSYAFRLVFQAKDRTLTDIEINTVMENIYQTAAERKWEVR